MNGTAVATEKISFYFGKRKVLEDLTLNIPKGVSFGLLGPNGAGKTTLIRLMVGLLRPRSGSLRLLGEPVSSKTSKLIGYMPQLQSIYNELSVMQNVDFFARIYHLSNRAKRAERVEKVLRLVELWDRRKDSVSNLSGGMRQRVSLACALVHDPPLLFLDEPTVGMDPELRAGFWEFFGSLTKQGVTLIISSHTMDDAAHCDRLAFLRDGKVIAEGPPEELKKAAGKPGASLEDAFLHFVRSGKEAAHV
jgi:ABC-2 type transport system ATP-binding protein